MAECPTAKFVPKPLYRTGDITRMLNAFAQEKAADRHGQRPIWNRWRVRRQLKKKGLGPTFTLVELKRAWPELVDSMILIDAYEDARAA